MLDAVRSSCPSSTYPIERSTRSDITITLVALIALALVVVGVLAIVANLPNPPQGLGIMSNFSLKAGIGFTAAGGSLFFVTILVAASLKSKESLLSPDHENPVTEARAKAVIESTRDLEHLNFQTLNHWLVLYTEATWKPKESKLLAEKLERKKEKGTTFLTENEKKDVAEAAQQAATLPVLETLRGIYKDEKNLPAIYNCHDQPAILHDQIELLLLTDSEILDLKISDVEQYNRYQMHILAHRLMLIEASFLHMEAKAGESLTLGQLRAITDRDKIIETVENRLILARLLSPQQVATLLGKPGGIGGFFKKTILSDQDWIDALLPITTKMERVHSKAKLALLHSNPGAISLLSQLPATRIVLLPDHYFDSANWKWTPLRIQQILVDLRPSFSSDTARIVKSLSVSTIKEQVESLTIDHFKDFTAEQLRDLRFPWIAFSQKAGWGAIAREKISLCEDETNRAKKNSIAILYNKLPWKMMNREALKEFFKPEDDLQQKQDLSILPVDLLTDLQEIWNLQHLQHFSHVQRIDPQFPWQPFRTPGIGNKLRKIYAHHDELEKISLDLTQLPSSELTTLFNCDHEKATAKHLLKNFKVDQIAAIAHALTAEHLPLLVPSILKDPAFPWASFLNKAGIGNFLFENRYMVISIQDHIPWELFPASEIDSLFRSIFGDGEYIAGPFFQALKMDVIVKLAPKLEARHLNCCTMSQACDEAFPWTEFIKKKGIGASIRRNHNKIALTNIAWDELAKSKEEMEAMLTTTKDIGVSTRREFLQALHPTIFQPIQTYLLADDLTSLTVEQLSSPHFPWKAFIAKEKFGLALSKILLDSKDDLGCRRTLVNSIPWTDLKSSESKEFEAAFSARSGYAECKQSTMQAIPIETFRTLVTTFGPQTFTTIANSAPDGRQRNFDRWFTAQQQQVLGPK